MDLDHQCPCGSEKSFKHCCHLLLSDRTLAQTPEQLMRSRYTAYVIGDLAYIRKTWHRDYCPPDLSLEGLPEFIRLQIVSHSHSNNRGYVHFRAFYYTQDELTWMEEQSQFVKLSECWLYTTGEVK